MKLNFEDGKLGIALQYWAFQFAETVIKRKEIETQMWKLGKAEIWLIKKWTLNFEGGKFGIAETMIKKEVWIANLKVEKLAQLLRLSAKTVIYRFVQNYKIIKKQQ